MDAKMRRKAKKQRKMIQIFLAPIKILRKIGHFYVKSMEYCATQVAYGSSVAPSLRLPKSLSVNSFPACDDEEFRQMLRDTSKEEAKQTAFQTSTLPRSYSVSVGKIGRIDEEEPCSFEEHGLKSELLLSKK